MQQRVRRFYRGQRPSSVRQLPIMTALHAEFPTLFAVHTTSLRAKSKYLISNIVTLYQSFCKISPRKTKTNVL